jgi:hypothetical protein
MRPELDPYEPAPAQVPSNWCWDRSVLTYTTRSRE